MTRMHAIINRSNTSSLPLTLESAHDGPIIYPMVYFINGQAVLLAPVQYCACLLSSKLSESICSIGPCARRPRGAKLTLRQAARKVPGFPAVDLWKVPGYRGWCSAHTCVTAAAAALEGWGESCRDFLRTSQLPDGGWRGYWWCDDEYTTALAAEALARHAGPEDHCRVQRAVEWACSRIGPEGAAYSTAYGGPSPFATAWCVRTLVLAQDLSSVRDILALAVKWLLEHQRTDGAWPPSARLRLPPPDVLDPEQYQDWVVDAETNASGTSFLDRQANFTTATALAALARVRARG